MIFRKSLLQEMTWVAFGLFIVLLLIVLTTQILRLLGEAAIGALASNAIWVVMAFTVVRYLPALLAIMVYASVLWVLTRMWRESEMMIWFASGQSIRSFISPVLRFMLPIVIVIILMAGWGSPWAVQKTREYRENAMRQEEVSQIAPGIFRASSNADRVYFVENFSTLTRQGNNVFAQIKRKDGRVAVVVAAKGGVSDSETEGESWLWMRDGRSYEGIPGTTSYDLVQFGKARYLVGQPAPAAVSVATRAMSSVDLWKSKDKEHKAELAGRIAVPIAALLLGLLAIPLAFFNPRGAKSFNLFLAIGLGFLYFNCINVAQAWIVMGKISPKIAIWPLHGAMALLVIGMFWWRSRLRR